MARHLPFIFGLRAARTCSDVRLQFALLMNLLAVNRNTADSALSRSLLFLYQHPVRDIQNRVQGLPVVWRQV